MNSVSLTPRFLGNIVSLTVFWPLGLLSGQFVVAQPLSPHLFAQQAPVLLPEKPLPNSPKVIPTPSLETIQQYNHLMQAGYASAQLRHYPEARQRFQEALNLRPNDIYARQAIFNIDTYQTINKQKFPPLIWLLVGVVLMTIGVCGIFFFLLHQSQQQFLKEVLNRREKLNPLQQSLQNGIFPGLAPGSATTTANSAPIEEPIIAVSALANVPPPDYAINVELTTSLLAELNTTDSRKRRKVILELGQKADSQAIKPLVDLMMNTDPQERTLILEALSQINIRSLIPMNQALALAHEGQEG